ncbi:uncharacterized protein LOC124273302 isoform X2 [Haliotis rubra]|uniref:uncharacterized protein LOC124273302 isoform X2 n=1 Tax=Haliotis rubra TaxID=36100 RepID=UPI001EE62DEF|nr:uncharacterized protein LOC124273302 isoform X2 [Haliotis rubra]
MGRLRQRVRNFGKIQGMPQMALVHLTTEGTLKVVGHQDMVEAVGRSNLVNILNIAPVAPATTQEEEKVDLRRISMAVDYADVRDVHLLRRAVTQVPRDPDVFGETKAFGLLGGLRVCRLWRPQQHTRTMLALNIGCRRHPTSDISCAAGNAT